MSGESWVVSDYLDHRSPHYRCMGSFASVSAGSVGAPLAFANSSRRRACSPRAGREPLERARRVARERVRREQRQRDRRVEVAHHGVGQPVGIDLAPAHRLGRRRAGQAARVGARVGDLQEVVVALLVDAEHFLDLRLGLQHEVLRAAAAAGSSTALFPPPRLAPSTIAAVSLTSRVRVDDAACSRRAPARRRSCRSTSRPATTCRSGTPHSYAAAEQRLAADAERLLALARRTCRSR